MVDKPLFAVAAGEVAEYFIAGVRSWVRCQEGVEERNGNHLRFKYILDRG